MGENNDILAKIRAAMEAKRLSCQKVAKLTEEYGEAVSESTVRRMLRDGALLEDFRYETSIRPVVRVVLGLDEETEEPAPNDPEQAEQYYTTIEAMKAVIDFKHEQLAERTEEVNRLREEIKFLREHQKEEIARVETSDQKKVDYLKTIIQDLQNASKWYKKVIGVLGVIVFMVVIALIIDLSLGGVGWIRY